MPSAIGPLANLQAATAVDQQDRTPKGELDKDAFLTLLAAQMRHQDPNNAQDLSQQMAQVAQMSIVEQLTTLNAQTEVLNTAAQATHAQALVGRTVSYAGPDGAPVTGVVERVVLGGEHGPRLTVGGVDDIDPQTLVEVR